MNWRMPFQTKTVFFDRYVFHVWGSVYEPAEDSFMIAENLLVSKGEKVLDMGTGCGILGVVAAEKASLVVSVDINPDAVRCAKENAKINGVAEKMLFINGDLFSMIRPGVKFDLIMFNPPYLPSDIGEDREWIVMAWAGGLNGRAVIDRFLHDVQDYLRIGGRVLLVQSTLADVDMTLKIFEGKGFKARIVEKRNLPFFEVLVLIEAWYNNIASSCPIPANSERYIL